MKDYFNAYYFGFDATGVPEVDEVIRLVAAAGKAYHHTEYWADEDERFSLYGDRDTYVKRIQEAADAAASAFKRLQEVASNTAAEAADLQEAYDTALDNASE